MSNVYEYEITIYAEMPEDEAENVRNHLKDVFEDVFDEAKIDGKIRISKYSAQSNSDVTPDIILADDTYQLDLRTGELKIDKEIFDHFVKDSIIKVQFPDEDDKPIYKYIMVNEDSEWIYCDFIE